jgi:hypothetical protein
LVDRYNLDAGALRHALAFDGLVVDAYPGDGGTVHSRTMRRRAMMPPWLLKRRSSA